MPMRATLMVSPGEAPWTKRSTGSVLNAAAAPATLDEVERKLRRVTEAEGGTIRLLIVSIAIDFTGPQQQLLQAFPKARSPNGERMRV
jgi:hypothetical protein